MRRWQIIVCCDNTVSWKREYDDADMGVVDASIVGSHHVYRGRYRLRNNVDCSHFDPRKVRTAYALPDKHHTSSDIPNRLSSSRLRTCSRPYKTL